MTIFLDGQLLRKEKRILMLELLHLLELANEKKTNCLFSPLVNTFFRKELPTIAVSKRAKELKCQNVL